jgi:parallel beta-helix repeat protein
MSNRALSPATTLVRGISKIQGLRFSAVRRGRWKATPVATTASRDYCQTSNRALSLATTLVRGITVQEYLFGSAQGEVEGNACRNNGIHGIAAHDQSRLVARNNTCEGNGNCGVLLDDRASGRVENNTCSHNEFGIYKERTARAYVGYNECYSNSVENILLNQ